MDPFYEQRRSLLVDEVLTLGGAERDLSDAGLYNLSEDIGETRNRAAERPDKVKALGDLWQQWNRQLAKPSWAP